MLCAPVDECRLLVARLHSAPIEASLTERQEDRIERRYSSQAVTDMSGRFAGITNEWCFKMFKACGDDML